MSKIGRVDRPVREYALLWLVACLVASCASTRGAVETESWSTMVSHFEAGYFVDLKSGFEALASERLEDDRQPVLQKLHTRYWVARVRALQGRLEEARSLEREIEMLLRGEAGVSAASRATWYVSLASLANAQDDFDEAERYLLVALDLLDAPTSDFEKEVKAVCLSNLAANMILHGKFQEANGLLGRAEELSTDSQPLVRSALTRHVAIASRNGDIGEIGKLLEALDRQDKHRDRRVGEKPCHQELLEADAISSGSTRAGCERPEKAVVCVVKSSGPWSYSIVEPLMILGACEFNAGRFMESREAYRRALTLVTDAFGDGALDGARIMLRLVLIESELGNKAGAHELLQKVSALVLERTGEKSRLMAEVFRTVATLAQWEGRIDDSLAANRKSASICLPIGGEAGKVSVEWARGLAAYLARQGRLQDGLAVVEEAIGWLRLLTGDPVPQMEYCLHDTHASILNKLDRPEHAKVAVERKDAIAKMIIERGQPLNGCE